MAAGSPPIPEPANPAVPVIVVTPVAVGVDPNPTVAAIAVGLRDEQLSPVLVSPIRTGRPEVGDAVDEHPAARLAGGLETIEPVRLYDEGPPVVAARSEAHPLPPVAVLAALVAQTARRPDVDLVLLADGVGLFTPMDEDGASLSDLLDLAAALQVRIGTVIVCDTGPNTLHAAVALVDAVRERPWDLLGTVLTRRPEPSDDVGAYVAATLEAATGVPLLGSIPAGARDWDVQQFTDRAGAWLPIR